MAIEEVDFAFPPKWRRRSASLTLSPSLIMDSFSRKSLSYGRLPHQPLGLTIRKLDGSSFDIEVVDGELQLKEAVEDFVSHATRFHGLTSCLGTFLPMLCRTKAA